jgi:hypothetical protein
MPPVGWGESRAELGMGHGSAAPAGPPVQEPESFGHGGRCYWRCLLAATAQGLLLPRWNNVSCSSGWPVGRERTERDEAPHDAKRKTAHSRDGAKRAANSWRCGGERTFAGQRGPCSPRRSSSGSSPVAAAVVFFSFFIQQKYRMDADASRFLPRAHGEYCSKHSANAHESWVLCYSGSILTYAFCNCWKTDRNRTKKSSVDNMT